MKKALMIFCIVLVAVLACSVFVACNPQVNPGEDNNGHNQYEQAKYTVTFNVEPKDSVLTWNDEVQPVSEDGKYTFENMATALKSFRSKRVIRSSIGLRTARTNLYSVKLPLSKTPL